MTFQALKKASQEVEADEAEFDEEVKPDDGLGWVFVDFMKSKTLF